MLTAGDAEIRRPRRWPVVAAVAYWLALELRAAIQDFPMGRLTRFSELPGEAIILTSGVLLSVLIAGGLRRRAAAGLPHQIAVAASATLLASLAFAALVRIVFNILPPFIFTTRPLTLAWFAAETSNWLIHFGLWSAFVIALANGERARQKESELAATRALAQDAQLRALRYQINPHFLFNTLNSISTLVWEGDTEAAKKMIVGLSDFFRATLETDPTTDVPLAEEFAFQRLYLDLELVRFSDNLVVDIDLPPDLAGARLPALVLQPLVENAIKHGVSRGGTTYLRLGARREDGELRISLHNEGPGNAATCGTGTGLRNVEQRLKARFGERGRVETHRAAGSFRVELAMPLDLG